MNEPMGEYRHVFTCLVPFFFWNLCLSPQPPSTLGVVKHATFTLVHGHLGKLVPNYLGITVDLEGVGESSKCLL